MIRRIFLVILILLISTMMSTAFSADQDQTTNNQVEEQQVVTNNNKNVDPSLLTQGLEEEDFWMVLFITIVIGAIGGIVYELLILQGNIELPHKFTNEEKEEKFPYAIEKFMYDLGIIARMIIGGMAAIVGLWIFNPDSTFSWLAISVVSGSAGISIFRSMQDRLTAAIAQKDVSELRQTLHLQNSLNNKLEDLDESDPNYHDKKLALLNESKGLAGSWVSKK